MSRFAGLPAALKATKDEAKGKPEDTDETATPETNDDEGGKVPPTKSKKKEPEMADENTNAAVDAANKEGRTDGFKAATDRFNAVMASEHYAGREAAAGKLLTNASMFNASAEDITGILAEMPKAEQAALTEAQQREAAEEAGRKEMQAELAKQNNSGIDADGGKGGAEKSADATAVWDRAIKAVCPTARN